MKIFYFLRLILLTLLWIPCTSIASDKLTDQSNKTETIYEENYQEMVFIHTDKPYYLTGEVIRFKVYCMEKITTKPSQLSKVAYVEFLDTESTPQLQAKIELQNGTGFGEIYIPTNINSGNMVLRGYTRWMRNYGPEVYFHSIITIINPFKRLGLTSIAKVNESSINFYPEGGLIINGVETKIVFDCKNAEGLPIDVVGRLYANDTILVNEFRPLKNGIGAFKFTPDLINKYHIQVMHSDSSTSIHQLPQIHSKGFSLQIQETENKLVTQIFCNDPSLIKAQGNMIFILRQKGKILDTKNISLNLGRSSVEVDKSLMTDGVSSIAVLNAEGILLHERFVFKYSGTESGNLLKVEKNNFDQREKVIVEVSDEGKKPDSPAIDFSISISSHQEQFEQNRLGFDKYMLLDNSLQYIYGLEAFFEGSPANVSQSINDLLIAYPNKVTWQSSDARQGAKYIPEYHGPLLTAMITNKQTKEPAEAIVSYLSIPGKLIQFYVARSKSDGRLVFELNDFYGNNEIIIQTDYTQDSIYSISVDNPFSKEYLPINIPKFNIDENMENWILKQSENMQIENAYQKFRLQPPSFTSIDSLSFFNLPDVRYYLDDFTRFIVMEEVMREYVSGVNVRKNRDGFHFMVLDVDRNIIYEQNPLMLLDGVPVFDADEIIAMDPLKVEKIETVKRTFHKGLLDCKGIVSYTTYKGNLDGYSIHKDALVMQYPGLQPQKQYGFPSYPSSYDKRIKTPDFRNTLYWNPKFIDGINDGKPLEFYTSDGNDVYEIRIEGLDKDGHAYSEKSFIEVKKN